MSDFESGIILIVEMEKSVFGLFKVPVLSVCVCMCVCEEQGAVPADFCDM